MKKIIQYLFILALAACSTGRITTTNLHDLTAFEPNSQVYSLPQTRIVITATAVKTDFIPGPYQKYAKEFLGIDLITTLPNTSWKLVDYKLFSLDEPDPEQYYSVASTGDIAIEELLSDMTNKGFFSSSCDNYNNYQLAFDANFRAIEEFPFSDLSMKPFFFDEKRKKQKNTLEDSAFAMVPGLEKQFVAKSEKEKAFESAQFIFKLRKRRFKLISGQYENSYDSVALALSIKELNMLESNYLNLFTGKSQYDTITRVFSVVPASGEALQRFTLFRFSETTGFYTTSESEGIPVIVELEDLNKNEILNQLTIPRVNSGYQNMLFYRVPDKAVVTVIQGSHIALESEMPVYQLGALVPYFINPGKK
jgi:hypothetical protein